MRGFTKPFYIFTHDQVLIALCPSHDTTVENKEIAEVYNCANTDKDSYRFFALNRTGPIN